LNIISSCITIFVGSDFMAEELIESKATFGLHFEGESAIDAELLSKTIHDMAELTKLAAKEENSQAFLKMNVTAFKNGSFIVDFSAICELANNLFNDTATCIGFASSVVTIVGGFFAVKKHVKNSKAKYISEPDKNGNIEIENNLGQIISVKQASGAVLKNTVIENLTVNVVNYAIENNPNGGFSFQADGKDSSFSAEDLKEMSLHTPIEEEKLCKVITMKTILLIKKADLLGKSAWDFKYGDHNITARIEDEDLVSTAHSGAPVCAGDYINAELEIRVDLDDEKHPISGTEQYTVKNAFGGIQHKGKTEQTSLI
jgi:hypothetical protein